MKYFYKYYFKRETSDFWILGIECANYEQWPFLSCFTNALTVMIKKVQYCGLNRVFKLLQKFLSTSWMQFAFSFIIRVIEIIKLNYSYLLQYSFLLKLDLFLKPCMVLTNPCFNFQFNEWVLNSLEEVIGHSPKRAGFLVTEERRGKGK